MVRPFTVIFTELVNNFSQTNGRVPIIIRGAKILRSNSSHVSSFIKKKQSSARDTSLARHFDGRLGHQKHFFKLLDLPVRRVIPYVDLGAVSSEGTRSLAAGGAHPSASAAPSPAVEVLHQIVELAPLFERICGF
ncbi:hypothetical protein EVAR_10033_1 [Eumeta japonica]|uniref:Uncharacterized protein n=1 Tax=Eumeta variegata TaxID=151549 RepID=A0A4C1TR57_EUMVA|nr:hypothetical protein EVAR_10033_1 [Eumeta japonica]